MFFLSSDSAAVQQRLGRAVSATNDSIEGTVWSVYDQARLLIGNYSQSAGDRLLATLTLMVR